jgi:hypothetical protein
MGANPQGFGCGMDFDDPSREADDGTLGGEHYQWTYTEEREPRMASRPASNQIAIARPAGTMTAASVHTNSSGNLSLAQ